MTQTETAPARLSWTRQYGLDTGPVPITGYTSKEFYEREIERSWNRTWIEVGKLTDIPEPGDYFVRDLPWNKISVIVVRGKDGQVRAFHNVCAHRCNRILWDEAGNTKMLRCQFHAWAYALDGSLVAVSDEQNFFDLDKAQRGLTPINTETWANFVFVNLAPEPPQTLRDYLGSFYELLQDYPFDQFTREYCWAGEVNCNWKLVRDAFIESYHVSTVHRFSVGPSFSSQANPWSHNLSFAASTYHVQFSTYANLEYQPHPMELAAFQLSGGFDSVIQKEGRGQLPPGVNPTNEPEWSTDGNVIYPSTALFTFAGLYVHFHWWPIDVDRCHFEVRQCVRPPRNATERFVHEVGNASLHATVLEDLRNLEKAQAAYNSGAVKTVLLQDQEFAIRHAHHAGQLIAGPYPEA